MATHAFACSGDRPICASWLSPCCAAGLNGVMDSVSRTWCRASCRSHMVVARDDPMEPASTRMQLKRLEALAMSLASSPEMMMLVSGMKNMATPIPCTTCGQRTKKKSTSGENRVRM